MEDLYEFYLPNSMDPFEISVTSSATSDQCEEPLIFEVVT